VIGKKVCPSATSSTTDPTWTGLVLNPGDRSERPKIKRLTHDRAVSSGNSLLPLIVMLVRVCRTELVTIPTRCCGPRDVTRQANDIPLPISPGTVKGLYS
jgi:hypothetical protein